MKNEMRFILVGFGCASLVCGCSSDNNSSTTAMKTSVVKERGFVSVGKLPDGGWTFLDPDSKPLFIKGSDWIVYEGHKDGKDGRYHYKEVNDKKFGGDRNAWAAEAVQRLKSWGFNSIGSGSQELRGRGLYHTTFVGIGSFRQEQEYRIPPKFPNVFHPEWEKYCDAAAKSECARWKGDRSLIGYFFSNELHWWGDGKGGKWEHGLFYAASILPDDHTAKKALLEYTGGKTNVSDAVKEGFIKLCAEKYFSTITKAVRKYDQDHLLLGCRFMGGPYGAAIPAVWEIAGKYCDAVSVNVYPHVKLDTMEVMSGRLPDALPFRENYGRCSEWAKKPLFISEWSFLGLDAGLSCEKGCGTRYKTQTERARAAKRFLKEMQECGFVVGADWFMWVDEPRGGLAGGADGEDGNYGLVNEQGVPYNELTTALK